MAQRASVRGCVTGCTQWSLLQATGPATHQPLGKPGFPAWALCLGRSGVKGSRAVPGRKTVETEKRGARGRSWMAERLELSATAPAGCVEVASWGTLVTPGKAPSSVHVTRE